MKHLYQRLKGESAGGLSNKVGVMRDGATMGFAIVTAYVTLMGARVNI